MIQALICLLTANLYYISAGQRCSITGTKHRGCLFIPYIYDLRRLYTCILAIIIYRHRTCRCASGSRPQIQTANPFSICNSMHLPVFRYTFHHLILLCLYSIPCIPVRKLYHSAGTKFQDTCHDQKKHTDRDDNDLLYKRCFIHSCFPFSFRNYLGYRHKNTISYLLPSEVSVVLSDCLFLIGNCPGSRLRMATGICAHDSFYQKIYFA